MCEHGKGGDTKGFVTIQKLLEGDVPVKVRMLPPSSTLSFPPPLKIHAAIH